MLKQRILTASVLLPFFIWLVLFAKNQIFFWVTTFVIILAGIEWLKLLKIHKNFFIFLFSLLTYVTIILTISFYDIVKYLGDENILNNFEPIKAYDYAGILLISVLFWILAFFSIIIYSCSPKRYKNFCENSPKLWKFLGFLGCIIALIPSWIGINYMKAKDPRYLLVVMFIVISTDLGGYLFGKLFGKHQLSIVSPKKTWEGLIGSYILCLLVTNGMIILFFNYAVYNLNFFLISGIASLGCIFAVIGDLFESLLKRIAGVKDSGNILPGHGGILDRIDSFCAVVPVFALLLKIFELIAYRVGG